MDIKQLIIQFVIKILPSAGVGALVAFGIFRFLGSKWIENKFAKRLQDHKHKLEKEREELKFKINSLLNRVTKIHEKEFEVLPIAWEKLDNLLDSVRQFIRETHSMPDLNNKSSQELEEVLSKQDLNEEEKQNVRDHKDREGWHFHAKSEKVRKACWDFQDYITKNAIFLSSDLKSEFRKAEGLIRKAWAIRETAGISDGNRKEIQESCRLTQDKIPPMMTQIEELVQKRLRFYEA